MSLILSPLDTYRSFLRKGKLAYQYDVKAQKAIFFPRVIAPETGHTQIEWRESAGLGTVYSFTVITPKEGDSYNVVLIDMDEGYRLMSRIEGISIDALHIGMRVQGSVKNREGEEPYPIFVMEPQT